MTAVAQVPLVGRDGELAVLRSSVGEAAAGRGGALVVTGAPGIGKSVLLDAAAREAGDAGARVLRASGVGGDALKDLLWTRGPASVDGRLAG